MRSEVSKKETRGHMLLVALIPRYKKSTHERNKRWPSHKETIERKRKKIEQERVEGCRKGFLRKRNRDRKNLKEGRLVLSELNFSPLFACFHLSMEMYLMVKMSIVTVLLPIIN